MNPSTQSARDIAVRALRDQEGNVSAHLERLLSKAGFDSPDRALATELALGTLRRRGTLDKVLRVFLSQPDKRMPGALNEILQVALYQILFLDRVPDFAVVNEAVEQAGKFHHRRKAGFVNGVLRTVARNVSEVLQGDPPREPDVIPLNPNAYRRIGKAVFDDPGADPASYLAEAFSLPAELARRWIGHVGLEQAGRVAMCSNLRAPMILRVNRLRDGVATVLAKLATAGVDARAHQNGLSVVLAEGLNVRELAVFQDGLVQPQDATPTAFIEAAPLRPGMRVLDLCAAPGTKTTHMAERMANRGSITAVDVSPEKLAKVQENCGRLGIEIVTTMLADQVGSLSPQSFDLVVVDAPCSNTGVLSRRAEARWRFSTRALAGLVKDQQFLAAAGARFVKPGGALVYSTCSIEPEECAELAKHLLRVDPRLALAGEDLVLPGGAEDPAVWHDGGYEAIFRAE